MEELCQTLKKTFVVVLWSQDHLRRKCYLCVNVRGVQYNILLFFSTLEGQRFRYILDHLLMFFIVYSVFCHFLPFT